jgi:hypothetical protein
MPKPGLSRPALIASAMTCLVLSAGACGAVGAEELDLAVTYGSLSEVELASTDTVLFATTSDSRLEDDGGPEFVVTQAVVIATDSRGDIAAGDTIAIRQMKGNFTNIAPVVEPRRSYVAYVEPWTSFEMAEGTDTGQVGIVGGATWRVDGDAARRTTPDSFLPSRVRISSDAGELTVLSADS